MGIDQQDLPGDPKSQSNEATADDESGGSDFKRILIFYGVLTIISIPFLVHRGKEVVREYLIEKAAERGMPKMQTAMGYRYEHGIGVQRDLAVALRWYELAAKQGYSLAEYNTGVMYRDGIGTATNPTEAVSWFRKSAEHGFASGMYSLAVQLRSGSGVKRDLSEAYTWMSIAAGSGFQRAVADLPGLEKSLTAEQVVDARKVASEKNITNVELPESGRGHVHEQVTV